MRVSGVGAQSIFIDCAAFGDLWRQLIFLAVASVLSTYKV